MARRYKPTSRYRKRTRQSRSAAQRRARSFRYSRARARTSYRARAFIPRNTLGAPRVVAKLRYATNITLDPTAENLGATGSNVWQFSANGLYDPDITSTGHQPMFFDNYMSIYQRYRVMYSKISVTVVNHAVNTDAGVAPTPNYAYRLFILKDGSGGVTSDYATTMNSMIEQGSPNIKWRFVGPSLTGRLPKLTSAQIPNRTLNLSPRDNTLVGNASQNPDSAAYWYVGITSADGIVNPPACTMYITIMYDVHFYERNNVQTQN